MGRADVSPLRAVQVYDTDYGAALAVMSALSLEPLIAQGKMELTHIVCGPLGKDVWALVKALPLLKEVRVLPPPWPPSVPNLAAHVSPATYARFSLLATGEWDTYLDTDVFYLPPLSGEPVIELPLSDHSFSQADVLGVSHDYWLYCSDTFSGILPPYYLNAGVVFSRSPELFQKIAEMVWNPPQELTRAMGNFLYGDQSLLNYLLVTLRAKVRLLPPTYNWLDGFLWRPEASAIPKWAGGQGRLSHLCGFPKFTEVPNTPRRDMAVRQRLGASYWGKARAALKVVEGWEAKKIPSLPPTPPDPPQKVSPLPHLFKNLPWWGKVAP